MKQAGQILKMGVRSARNVSITNNGMEMNSMILHALLFTLALLSFGYVFILGNMVFDIVGRKALEKEMLALSSEIGELELTYLSAANGMDESMSAQMGFKETTAAYAARKSLGSLSVGFNEI